ncbi:hypothetical protein AAHA92_29421 [Salvia divinorum]|uniref:Myb/SANT-like domain-containing protein n=1 Tax=Salvia divinorum TaxID=28513 RepID=A0ABD1G1I5_SALDI
MSGLKRAAVNPNGCSTEGEMGVVRSKFRKGDRSRRMWTVREEEILIASLLELVALGWKSDNGFRAGYLGKIEENIRKEFSTFDIKGTPHVVSKITAWKKSYGSLRGILGRSGVGFNMNGEYKIDIDDDQWAQVVMVDREAKFMRNKSWPYWEAWKCIFGKDRASGVGAEEENDYIPTFEDFLGNEVPPNVSLNVEKQGSSEVQSQHVSTTKSAGQMRKLSHSDDALMEFLGNLHEQTNSRLDIISSRIGYEFDLGKARQEVFDKLGCVEGLTLDQRYELCDILCDKPQRLEVFMGMPMNAKLGYVLRLINHNRASV